MSPALFLMIASLAQSPPPPVYVLLWFDTEDYITPADDDACLRLAQDLRARNVRATFKVVAEKARVLEQRNRRDVIDALGWHDIGYHTENHSIPPAPAVYLRRLNFEDGAKEFREREERGLRDVMRIFGVDPVSTYGQPGSSWGPQVHSVLREWRVPTYIDEGRHIGLDNQPFWYGNLLYVFNLGPNSIRVDIEAESKFAATLQHARGRAAALQSKGGGVMHFWYHPNEFVTTEFWDAVNFSRGANPPRDQWKHAQLRSPADAERAYGLLNRYVDELKKIPGVRFVTAREMPALVTPATPARKLSVAEARGFLRQSIDWHERWSAAELLSAALGSTRMMAGPSRRGVSTYTKPTVPRVLFDDLVKSLAMRRELPAEVWIESETLSLGDFAATLAHAPDGSADVAIKRGALAFEKYVATDPCATYSWLIHTVDFCAPELLELAKIEAWTLKPAPLRLN